MVQQLVAAQEAAMRMAHQLFATVDETHDKPTADLLTRRIQVHEKNAWMLRG